MTDNSVKIWKVYKEMECMISGKGTNGGMGSDSRGGAHTRRADTGPACAFFRKTRGFRLYQDNEGESFV